MLRKICVCFEQQIVKKMFQRHMFSKLSFQYDLLVRYPRNLVDIGPIWGSQSDRNTVKKQKNMNNNTWVVASIPNRP